MAQTSPVLSSINAIMQQKRTLESMLDQPRMKPNCIKLVNDMHRALTKDQRDLRLTDEGVEFMLGRLSLSLSLPSTVRVVRPMGSSFHLYLPLLLCDSPPV
eukprot:TRINITY_DN1513_c0_g1_i1.p1 TRINITY_DN1513_c0_g1~~TRINITY_DN1513_c0_g1_i1.p1  ORF type:complete len:101 (+),score=9.97 TRINITY_DN1513_c0_g1_i1:428-730(+)